MIDIHLLSGWNMTSALADAGSLSQSPWLWKWLVRPVAIYIALPYLAVTLIFVFFQRTLMYKPTVRESLLLQDVLPDEQGGRDVELQIADGVRLQGWLLTAISPDDSPSEQNPLVLYFAGNSGNRLRRIDDLREIRSSGFDVLIFDYRGYGDSTGSPSEKNFSTDAWRIWQYARDDLGYDESEIVLFGESMGGAVVLSMWDTKNQSPPEPAAVILNSTFASMGQVARFHYPQFPFQFLLLDRWPSIKRITRVQVPVIVFHGSDDTVVPLSQGRALAEAAQQGEWHEIPGGIHNDIPPELFRRTLSSLRQLIKDRPASRPSLSKTL